MSDEKIRRHKPDDPYNCLCAKCVHASLCRMGLGDIARRIRKEEARSKASKARVS